MLKGDEEQSSLGSKLNKNKSKEKGSQCAWKDVEMGGGRCDLCPFWHSNHPQTAFLTFYPPPISVPPFRSFNLWLLTLTLW